ncbi:MAG: hypothetical protein DRG31_01305 [Deltaproteobacteria bacterium]|nr:MAG: hypothetical protein DRG31_01305 [Deltaproteobacteria bacterium]
MRERPRICVIDGQGGGIGSLIVRRLREAFEERVEILALGTNAAATMAMMKARANRGASGENAICQTVKEVDVIIGPLSIILANSMLGELTPRMSEAIASSPALKFLLPLTQEKVTIVGLRREPLPHYVDELIQILKETLDV